MSDSASRYSSITSVSRHRSFSARPPTAISTEYEINYPIIKDVNILLMGPSGVGKSTFINAFANYIKFNSLDLAEAGQMQVLIPSSIILSATGVDEQYEDTTIQIGDKNDPHELPSARGQSSTQICRSFVFTVGNRKIRLIDTPGVGDCRGLEQDSKNLQDVLAYIAQFSYLNAICILSKPNEERLSIAFKYCVQEVLRHLHPSATKNLVFLFTNARSTFFRPGKTKSLLQEMFKEHQNTYHIEIPITTDNSFLFDNEAFRYLAIRKQSYSIFEEQHEIYTKSWTKSVEQCLRLLKYVIKLPEHNIEATISLNTAQQLILKLPRPIAEITRLIEENIELAKKFQRRAEIDPSLLSEGIPQNAPEIEQFTHPRMVCGSAKCTQTVRENGETRVEYKSICHDRCYLKGVVQEMFWSDKLQDCQVIDYKTNKCTHCGCKSSDHIHLTYQYKTSRTYKQVQRFSRLDRTSVDKSSATGIDQYIKDLQQESQQIQNVYKQLAEFVHTNSMFPINDALVGYLDYMINLERTKNERDKNGQNVLASLERIKKDYEHYFDRLQRTLKENSQRKEQNPLIEPRYMVNLVETLYALPINGKSIRDQVGCIRNVETRSSTRYEREVTLPAGAVSSTLAEQLKQIFSP